MFITFKYNVYKDFERNENTNSEESKRTKQTKRVKQNRRARVDLLPSLNVKLILKKKKKPFIDPAVGKFTSSSS